MMTYECVTLGNISLLKFYHHISVEKTWTFHQLAQFADKGEQ